MRTSDPPQSNDSRLHPSIVNQKWHTHNGHTVVTYLRWRLQGCIIILQAQFMQVMTCCDNTKVSSTCSAFFYLEKAGSIAQGLIREHGVQIIL